MNNTRFFLMVIFLIRFSGTTCCMVPEFKFEGQIQMPDGYPLIQLFKEFGLEDFGKKTFIVGYLGNLSFSCEEIKDHFETQLRRYPNNSGVMDFRDVTNRFNKLLERIYQTQEEIVARKKACEEAREEIDALLSQRLVRSDSGGSLASAQGLGSFTLPRTVSFVINKA